MAQLHWRSETTEEERKITQDPQPTELATPPVLRPPLDFLSSQRDLMRRDQLSNSPSKAVAWLLNEGGQDLLDWSIRSRATLLQGDANVKRTAFFPALLQR